MSYLTEKSQMRISALEDQNYRLGKENKQLKEKAVDDRAFGRDKSQLYMNDSLYQDSEPSSVSGFSLGASFVQKKKERFGELRNPASRYE
jgi:hypothetical protein